MKLGTVKTAATKTAYTADDIIGMLGATDLLTAEEVVRAREVLVTNANLVHVFVEIMQERRRRNAEGVAALRILVDHGR